MGIIGYRLELKLNKMQSVLCVKSAGTARFAYNYKLKELNESYEKAKKEAVEQGLKKPNCKFGTSIDWHKEWVRLKAELPWIRETSKCCGQEALRDLEGGFKRFFSKKAGYPAFKRRGINDAFRLTGTVKIGPDYAQLPTFGKIKLKEKGYVVSDGELTVKQATVKRQADRWYVSFCVDNGVPDQPLSDLSEFEISDIVGLDLGTKELGITSEGEVFENPKAYKAHLTRLRRYQRSVSRKQKGSSNKKKAIFKLSRVHRRIANIRSDAAHKMTSSLTNLNTSLAKAKSKILVIESLRPKNMSKNHKLAGSILDAAFGRIKTLLTYKCRREGVRLVYAPTFYASSKYCSCCGWKYKELSLTEREWTCRGCGKHHDRDVNAAKNLQFFGAWLLDLTENTESSSEINACGDERLQFLIEQCSSMKQEFESQSNAPHNFRFVRTDK
jgi:putative transposase